MSPLEKEISLSWGISLAEVDSITPSQLNAVKIKYSIPIYSLYVLSVARIYDRESITLPLLVRVACVNYPPAWPYSFIADVFVTLANQVPYWFYVQNHHICRCR